MKRKSCRVATGVILKRTKSREMLFSSSGTDKYIPAVMFLLVSEKLKIIIRALGGLNWTGVCHFSNRRDVCGDSFHALRSPGVSGVEMKIYERSLQALLSSARRSRVLAKLASLA